MNEDLIDSDAEDPVDLEADLRMFLLQIFYVLFNHYV